jgi:hypothetical protein
LSSGDDLGSKEMVCQPGQLSAVELRISNDDPRRIDQRDPSSKSAASGVRKRIRFVASKPPEGDEPGLAFQTRGTLVGDAVAETGVHDGEDRDNEDHDDRK